MPKNIVILSDGTGNAASSRTATNVWRLYQALDLSDPEKQVAFYDDGVGTERWKPVRMIGSGFGYGLKENVIDMYQFLSRVYDDGDRVFIYGFSRGAYTVRVLVGLVHYCGLVRDALTEADRAGEARKRYRRFRKRFALMHRRRTLRFVLRGDRAEETPSPPADETKIAFLGVWDTVDAYGMPIDEMAVAWDTFVFPYRFTDRTLSPIVGQAAHAIALDDERHTFHPVLWDESRETGPDDKAEGGSDARERIRQVWFAGAHANVGGGYPDDSLAHVPLDWMLSEIENAKGNSPLHFLPDARETLARRADVHGKLYNSRSGLRTYYRFKPRNVLESCNDRANGVTARPRIHESVFRRLGAASGHYAPFALPKDYELVPMARGPMPEPFESEEARARRTETFDDVWDLVHWRRWLYVALLLVTLVAVISPAILPWSEAGACPSTGPLCFPESVLNFVSPLLPGWSVPWQKALGQNPSVLFVLLLVIAVQFVLSRVLRRAVGRHAAAAWRLSLAESKEPGSATAPPAPLPAFATTVTRWLRSSCTGVCAARRNMTLALMALVLMALVAVMLGNKLAYSVGAALGLTCSESTSTTRLAPGDGQGTVTVDVGNSCHATGLILVGGQQYTISVTPLPAPGVAPDSAEDPYVWRDGPIPAGPDGFAPDAADKHLSWLGERVLKVGVMVRRVWTEDWFVLMGQIGENSLQPFPIAGGIRQFTAPATGELYVYVNDAVIGLPFVWDAPYTWSIGANRGKATIEVAPYRPPEPQNP